MSVADDFVGRALRARSTHPIDCHINSVCDITQKLLLETLVNLETFAQYKLDISYSKTRLRYLTHVMPLVYFYTLWKYEENDWFSHIFMGYRKKSVA